MMLIIKIVKKRDPEKVNHVFKRLQLVSGGFVAFAHGTNDAQKTMGIIALALIANHPNKNFSVPLWVVVASATAMAFGTYLGGWRIVHTLGQKITHLEPPQGFAAETSTAIILWFTAHLGFPVSTTHTVSGSILGAGAATRPSVVRWGILRNIGIAWLITIPCAALVGATMVLLTHLRGGSGLVVLVAIPMVSAIFLTRNWTWESTAQIRARLNFLQKMRKSRMA
jgi:PiT family inorganic phosphate transporter